WVYSYSLPHHGHDGAGFVHDLSSAWGARELRHLVAIVATDPARAVGKDLEGLSGDFRGLGDLQARGVEVQAGAFHRRGPRDAGDQPEDVHATLAHLQPQPLCEDTAEGLRRRVDAHVRATGEAGDRAEQDDPTVAALGHRGTEQLGELEFAIDVERHHPAERVQVPGDELV